jgi:N-acetylmuramoyl-L-alanine amidase
MAVLRLLGLFVVCGAAVAVWPGCAAPSKLGPPPEPVLATVPPRVVPAIPAPPPAPAPAVPRPSGLAGATIVVDAGHGGHDPGALGRGPVPEKVVNLDIARRLAERLEEGGANVIMTRGSDRFISLDERAAIADRSRADLFVSIHADSSPRSSVTGMTIYVARGAGRESRRAAEAIAAALTRAGLELRGVQAAGYRVLVGHSRPGVLIECGFLSNRGEAARLASAGYRDQIAAAIAEGIEDYFSR